MQIKLQKAQSFSIVLCNIRLAQSYSYFFMQTLYGCLECRQQVANATSRVPNMTTNISTKVVSK